MPEQSVLIFASPNNPVGNSLSESDLRKILTDNPKSFIIADEAYGEFTKKPYTELLAEFDNLVLIRTFSKTMSAAGVRLGYCLGSALFIEQLRKLMVPYLLNHFTSLAASEVLKDEAALSQMSAKLSLIINERNKLYERLHSEPSFDFEVVPSSANFLLLRWSDGERCRKVYEGLIARGILLRDVSRGPGLAGCLRLTIGRPEDNQQVYEALKALC